MIQPSKTSRLPLFLFTFIFSIACGLLFTDQAHALTGTAQKVFQRNSQAVYQIRVIDIHSREKYVIGSGFRISRDGLFASNFHVISDVVDKPDQYRIEYFRKGRKVGNLTVEAIDVAHDLAILRGEPTRKKPVRLGSSKQKQGTGVYPMGNPLDVGMVVLEGTYNGLVGDRPYQHILLSAALNPGMSGGPAFDASGKVVGVNVAIEGNDLSYLVPVEYLIELKESVKTGRGSKNWPEVIQEQVLARYKHIIDKAVKSDWLFENLGALKVPQSILPGVVKCWGRSRSEDPSQNAFVFYGDKRCQSDRNIFLSSNLSTGTIGYSFFWLESQSLSSLEFYKRFSAQYAQGNFYPYATSGEVTKFSCHNSFVALASRNWKAAYCVRRYIKYPKLHDVFVSFAILGDSPRKYIIQVGMAGLTEPLARNFLNKFMGSIQWTE
ncbi:putative Peptidase S1 and S6, chymotrypsin/Hap [Nitrospina gracilis 3/211]|uniref:Putative Peptidase S1 and S6, chymotrypsin/Hap n=1 Tax=Nitrospina gracilis (strain 3/211) TaxID=1266370 RepID=M1YZK1_NITG3|nr:MULTISPECIES: serine protease [Nitrospina]MCF8723594.1 S1-C subfamily serine protease [Nitrospina sp. Nb-3]CCQ90670.1 putative Peptidase S1 and S6, chymotrypsin/Hap [Nitrospina gracilis 3/211]